MGKAEEGGYTTLTICQPLWKTSRKSFHSEEKKKADTNKQFFFTLLVDA